MHALFANWDMSFIRDWLVVLASRIGVVVDPLTPSMMRIVDGNTFPVGMRADVLMMPVSLAVFEVSKHTDRKSVV